MRERGGGRRVRSLAEVWGDGQSRALYYDTKQHFGASSRRQSKAQLSTNAVLQPLVDPHQPEICFGALAPGSSLLRTSPRASGTMATRSLALLPPPWARGCRLPPIHPPQSRFCQPSHSPEPHPPEILLRALAPEGSMLPQPFCYRLRMPPCPAAAHSPLNLRCCWVHTAHQPAVGRGLCPGVLPGPN